MLVYEVDQAKMPKDQKVDMGKLIEAVSAARESRRAEGSRPSAPRRRPGRDHHPQRDKEEATQVKDRSAAPARWSSASWPTTATTRRW